jgi:hypothetical protein
MTGAKMLEYVLIGTTFGFGFGIGNSLWGGVLSLFSRGQSRRQ